MPIGAWTPRRLTVQATSPGPDQAVISKAARAYVERIVVVADQCRAVLPKPNGLVAAKYLR